jgi:hypothetical protein
MVVVTTITVFPRFVTVQELVVGCWTTTLTVAGAIAVHSDTTTAVQTTSALKTNTLSPLMMTISTSGTVIMPIVFVREDMRRQMAVVARHVAITMITVASTTIVLVVTPMILTQPRTLLE